MLPQTLQFVVGVLTAVDPPMEPQKREGALRLIGCLADVLLRKKMYKVQVENMLVSQVAIWDLMLQLYPGAGSRIFSCVCVCVGGGGRYGLKKKFVDLFLGRQI